MKSLSTRYPHMRFTFYRRRFAVILAAAAFVWALVQAIITGPQYDCGPVLSARAVAGNTMWAIVESNCTGDIHQAVEDAIELNGGVQIQIGQMVYLPGK